MDELIPKMDITKYSQDTSPIVKVVLLTGVTGFLGTQLLYELLTTQPEISTIYCLIRVGKDRLNMNPIDIIKARFAYAKMGWLEKYDEIVKPVRIKPDFQEKYLIQVSRLLAMWQKRNLVSKRKFTTKFLLRWIRSTTLRPRSTLSCLIRCSSPQMLSGQST